MSQVYNLEPPTKGKVVLHTTHGDIEVELWPKEAPKVCEALFCGLTAPHIGRNLHSLPGAGPCKDMQGSVLH